MLTGLLGAARLGGWLVHHDRRSDRALQQGDAGFPDIVAVHRERGVIAWELKSEKGRLTDGQRRWLDAFRRAKVHTLVVYPSIYDAAVRWLGAVARGW